MCEHWAKRGKQGSAELSECERCGTIRYQRKVGKPTYRRSNGDWWLSNPECEHSGTAQIIPFERHHEQAS